MGRHEKALFSDSVQNLREENITPSITVRVYEKDGRTYGRLNIHFSLKTAADDDRSLGVRIAEYLLLEATAYAEKGKTDGRET